jgi:putative transposase
VGGEDRGYDGDKKVKGRKRHILVDTEGLVLKVRVHSAKVMDFERGSRRCCMGQIIRDFLASAICRWMPATAERRRVPTGSGKHWGGAWMSSSVHVRLLLPRRCSDGVGQGVAKEGVKVDWEHLLAPKGFQVLPRRWVVEWTIAWIEQNRRMSKDYERLCASGEALGYAAMIRLMTRRLTRL